MSDIYNSQTRPTYLGNAPDAAFQGGGVINRQQSLAGIGNSADSLTDTLFTYPLPANALDVAGRGVKITAWGKFAAIGDNKRVRLYFGATMVADSGIVTDNGTGWSLEAIVVKTGSNLQIAQGKGSHGSTSLGSGTPTTPTEVDTAVIVIKCTGEFAGTGTDSANEVLGQFFQVEALN